MRSASVFARTQIIHWEGNADVGAQLVARFLEPSRNKLRSYKARIS